MLIPIFAFYKIFPFLKEISKISIFMSESDGGIIVKILEITQMPVRLSYLNYLGCNQTYMFITGSLCCILHKNLDMLNLLAKLVFLFLENSTFNISETIFIVLC